MSKKIFLGLLLAIILLVLGCSSGEKATGEAINAPDIFEENTTLEPDIYEESGAIGEQTEQQTGENQIVPENETIFNETLSIEAVNETSETSEQNETVANETVSDEALSINQGNENIEKFEFSPSSIVSTQHNISLSIDGIRHEIKSQYWGKITEITTTVLNKGNESFKPKVLVLLYDEKDFKEEWLKPKAEIEFDIEKLNAGGHITRQAIVNIAFDDINLTKNFKLVLVDAADPGNKPIVVVERGFTP